MSKRLLAYGLVLPLLVGITACAPTTSADSKPSSGATQQADASPVESAPPLNEAPRLNEASQQNDAPSPGTALTPDNPDAVTAELCESPQTQLDMNQCAYQAYQAANDELSQLTQRLQAQVSDTGKQALLAGEQAWAEYRDLDCDFARQQYEGGSIVPLIYNSCLEAHTRQRIAELQQPSMPQLDYSAADGQLNQAYQQLLGVLSPERQETVIDIQLAWLEYRDDHCTFESQHHPNRIAETQCLSRVSETRTTEIRQTTEQRSL